MKHFHFATLSSTMDMAHTLWHKGTRTSFFVSADHQTQGRGRQGRVWHSLTGNLHVTYVFEIPAYISLSYLPFCFSLEILNSLLRLHSQNSLSTLSLKWPNDILLEGKKVGGMLMHVLESSPTHRTISLGIGINVQHTPIFDESHTAFLPTNLHKEGYTSSHKDVNNAITSQIATVLQNIPLPCDLPHYWDKIRHTWLHYCHHKDHIIQIHDAQPPYTIVKGRFITIDDNGHLVLEVAETPQEGKKPTYYRKSFATGDVFF